MSISILLATYNESEIIAQTIERLKKVLSQENFEIIVIDDDSPDQTWKIVSQLAEADARIKLIRRQGERGLTSAYQAGIRAATKEMVGWLDADLQHPPEALIEFMKTMRTGFDAVIGSRFLLNNSSDGDARLHRSENKNTLSYIHGNLSRALSILLSKIFRAPFTDWTSGYIVLRRELIQSIPLEGNHGEYFIPLLIELHKSGKKVKEMPYRLSLRKTGESKTGSDLLSLALQSLKYARFILKMKQNAKR